MPMLRSMPDFIERNHRKSTFVKESNPMSTKGVHVDARRFMAKAEPALIKAVPDAKQLVNRTLALERKAVAESQIQVNVFDESLKEYNMTAERKQLISQTASSLHPGHNANIEYRIKLLETKHNGLTDLATQNGRSIQIPRKY